MTGTMLLLVAGLTWCIIHVYGVIPPSNVCYQDLEIPNACVYGNLSVAVVGKTYTPRDCNRHINIKEFEQPPFLYINSTNATERFTVLIVDLGHNGRGPDYLQWMVTNVTINSLPAYNNIPVTNVLAEYMKPLLMEGLSHSTLVQIVVFRHQNVLRIPFGELWVTRRRNFSFRSLFSNISPTLRLCGPVAGIQFWLHQDSSSIPSAPMPPHNIPAPGQSGFVPHPPQPGFIPQPPQPGFVPQPPQPGFVPQPPQPGFVPQPPQPGFASQPSPGYAPIPAQPGFVPHPAQPGIAPPGFISPIQQPPHTTFPKKSLGTVFRPMQLLFVPLVTFVLLFL